MAHTLYNFISLRSNQRSPSVRACVCVCVCVRCAHVCNPKQQMWMWTHSPSLPPQVQFNTNNMHILFSNKNYCFRNKTSFSSIKKYSDCTPSGENVHIIISLFLILLISFQPTKCTKRKLPAEMETSNRTHECMPFNRKVTVLVRPVHVSKLMINKEKQKTTETHSQQIFQFRSICHVHTMLHLNTENIHFQNI